jgi:Rad3-related DNA helicase
MEFDLDQRSASLSVGEFSSFITGPRSSSGGPQGVWRAQLGTHWHNELRSRAKAETPATEFEIPITGRLAHRGWLITLSGRIDQLLRSAAGVTLREIKTVTRELPADEAELRNAYPDYFAQLSAYVELTRLGALDGGVARTTPPLPGAPGQCHALRDIPSENGPAERHVIRDIAETGAGGAGAVARAAAGQAAGGVAGRRRSDALCLPITAELCFVEVDSGLAQTVTLSRSDETCFRTQLERVVEFLELRHRARERLRHLRFRPAFARRRPGQETTEQELTATFAQHPLVLFEAPTGFGKTGVLLEFALGQLRSGHFDRVLYLTSKSTGQIQVVRTLGAMTSEPGSPAASATTRGAGAAGSTPPDDTPAPPAAAATPVAVWHVRNKAEHCVNTTFHCVRESCTYLAEAATRWPQSGLARFYIDERQARDLDTLRAAGREAKICPYEITRAALAFNDVWIGDYNYVFAPRNRGLFFEQPGFVAARTLLLLDEAHNLPSRVADAYSHAFNAADAYQLRDELHRLRPLAALVTAWDHWCHFLDHLRANHGLAPADEDDARHLLAEVAKLVTTVPLDLAELGPQAADVLWSVPSFVDELAATELPRLWWCPADRELVITCLDAAPAIGAALREFGGVVLASATLTPIDGFAAACGLDALDPKVIGAPAKRESVAPRGPGATVPDRLGALNKRDTKKLYRQLTTGAQLLRVEEERDAARPTLLRALTPWRDGAYDVAIDARVDTTFQHRSLHYTTTAASIASLHRSALSRSSQTNPDRSAEGGAPLPTIAVFFPSYAYAEALKHELADVAPGLRVALQPRVRDLAAQAAWVGESLGSADALFLVLGSSFAESIDALGGRIAHAIVVGPALPEVNPVQRARLAEAARVGLSREEAFRRVYQIPGMTKVNQALGRLVRAPGQRARVILQCRRFLEPSYAELLAPEYQSGVTLSDDDGFAAWLAGANAR